MFQGKDKDGLTPGQRTFMTNLDALALKYAGVNMRHINFRGGQYYDDRNNKVIKVRVDEPQNDANIGQTSKASSSSSASSTSSSNKKNLKRERQSSSKRKRLPSSSASNKRRKIVPSTNSASKNKRVGKTNTSSRVK